MEALQSFGRRLVLSMSYPFEVIHLKVVLIFSYSKDALLTKAEVRTAVDDYVKAKELANPSDPRYTAIRNVSATQH
jgi:hypothetical protein